MLEVVEYIAIDLLVENLRFKERMGTQMSQETNDIGQFDVVLEMTLLEYDVE